MLTSSQTYNCNTLRLDLERKMLSHLFKSANYDSSYKNGAKWLVLHHFL